MKLLASFLLSAMVFVQEFLPEPKGVLWDLLDRTLPLLFFWFRRSRSGVEHS